MNALLWRFPAWFHGLVYLLTGRRLAWDGERYRWLGFREYWAALIEDRVKQE